jgi:vitamin B12 transporter
MRRYQTAMLLYAAGLSPVFAQNAPPGNASPVAATPSDAQSVAPSASPSDTSSAASSDTVVPLHEIVVTATRIPTEIESIPAGVSVVDRNTMETRDYDTLTDALSALPGLRVSQSGGPGGNASVFIRGTNSDHVLVLLDGMPINDAADPDGAFNFGVDTLGDIERIEVVRGPMAAVYGANAVGGVINLITRKGSQPGVHITGDLAGGYPAQGIGTANVSGINGLWDYSATAEAQTQRGFDTTPQRETIYTGTPQPYSDMVGTLNLGLTPVAGTRISLLLRARQAVFDFDNLGNPNFDDDNSKARDGSLIGRIGVHSALFGGMYETEVFVGGIDDDRRYTEAFNPLDPNMATEDDKYHSTRTDVQWNNTVHLDDLLRADVLSATDLTFGYEYIRDGVNTEVNEVSGGFPYLQNTKASMTTNAGYAGLQTTLWQRLTVTGQVRQDSVLNDSPFTWRLGSVLDVPEISTHFHVAYGTAFRAPSLFERYGIDSFGYVGNPNLKPETAQGWEAGFGTEFAALGRRDFATFTATYFNEQVQELIETQFVPTYTSVNIGSAHMQGVETELTLRPAAWLSLDVTYTFTDAIDADTGQLLLRRPQNVASFDATVRPLPKLTIAPELLFTGAFQDFLINDAGIGTNTGTTGHGLIANLTVTYELTANLEVYAHANNIFDSRFEPVNGYQTPGPSLWVGMRFKI